MTLVTDVSQITSLDGPTEVRLTPVSMGTQVSVNAAFVLTMTFKATGYEYNASGALIQTKSVQGHKTITFTTREPGQITEAKRTGACRSLGTLEEQILRLAAP
jgi:hypothetical protein